MTYEQLTLLAEASRFTAWVPLNINTIQPKQEVRDMCAANTCGKYGASWCCPPGCGSLEDCFRELQQYRHGILVQTCGAVEDSFDYDGMKAIEAEHKARFFEMYRQLKSTGEKVLAIGTGSCTLCKTCTYPDAPCRFPEDRTASMEAYGILVLEVCKANGLAYYYGKDKISYTSCFLTL